MHGKFPRREPFDNQPAASISSVSLRGDSFKESSTGAYMTIDREKKKVLNDKYAKKARGNMRKKGIENLMKYHSIEQVTDNKGN